MPYPKKHALNRGRGLVKIVEIILAGDEGYRLKPPPLARKMSKLIFPRYATPHPRYVLLAQNIGGSDPDRETMKNARPKGLTIFMAERVGLEPFRSLSRLYQLPVS